MSDYFPEEGDKIIYNCSHNLPRIYIVREIRVQYQCELGPESLVELVFYEKSIFDPMWITVELLRLMIDAKIIMV